MWAIVYDEHYLSVSDFQWNKEETERYCLTGNSCRQKSKTLYAHFDQAGAKEVHSLMYNKVNALKRSEKFSQIQNEIRRLEQELKEVFIDGVKEIFEEVKEDKPHLFIGE